MGNHFLSWYNSELAALRKRAARFAGKHPKIAGRLRLTGEAVDDPHVDRIMQGFAYTAARIRQKLQDDFPELTDTLLEALYPQYLAQIPSMSIMKISGTMDQVEKKTVEAGFAVDTEVVRGDRCRYLTTQSVEVTPLSISQCKLEKPPFVAPEAIDLNARSSLSLKIELPDKVGELSELELDELCFFIKAPFATATQLYELVLNQTLGIAIAEHPDDKKAVRLPLSCLKPVGFEEGESVLPFPKRSFPGFRLLTEFFALPEKFLFFKLTGLKQKLDTLNNSSFQLFFYTSAAPEKLSKSVDVNSFDLHCTPVINLFPQRAEPVHIDQTSHEYDLVPDTRRNNTREIHSILNVTISKKDGESEKVYPFFGRKPASTENRAQIFWQHKRVSEDDGEASTSKLCLVDLSLNAKSADMNSVASVSTLCINRGLPELLPFGGGQPYLQSVENDDQIAKTNFLLPPTPTTRFDKEDGSYWRLISHLSLNHLPVAGEDPELLRDMLRLYDFRQAHETSILIDSIVGVDSKRATARLTDGSIVNGVDITVTFDDTTIDIGLAYLFGQILSHFFGLYSSINTFSRLTVKRSGINVPIVQFPPRTSNEVLL